MVAPDVDPAQVPLDPGRYDVRSGDREKLDLDSAGASLVVDWAWREGRRLRSITAWRGGDSQAVLDMDSLPPVLFNLQRDFREKQRSQEFQLHAQGETTRAVAGLYLFDGTEAGHGRSTWATPLFQSAQGSIRTRSAAVYGNLVRDLGPDWQLEAGVRHTIETKTATAFNAVWNDPGFSDPRLVNADFTDSARYGATTPRLALARRFGGGTLLYAQASRGFKGGTYNVRTDAVRYPQSVHPVDAETVDAFEVGMKGGWGDGRVEWSAALFHNDYRDIQLGVPVLSESGIFPDFRNAGSGTTRGAELEWRARLAPWLRWNGHLGFLDARYDEYIEGGENVAGQRHVPNSPRRTAGTSLVGEWPLRDGAALVARIDGRYQSRTWPNPELDPRLEQGGYALWNAALAWMSPRRRWDLTLRVDNLADTAYRTSAFSYGAGTLRGAVIGYYGPPRTLSATLGYRF